MTVTGTITSKGQLTLPRHVRKILNTTTVVIEVEGETVRLRPARSVAGALAKYAGPTAPLRDVREKVWGEVTRASKR
jgi:bifunctional DNA-binding transcriptional regulator/antitoxin component of YhaV-PrlF toxin-antitoxin module